MDNSISIEDGLATLAALNEAQSPYAGTENILFVDDEPLLLEMGMEALRSFGYTVEGALNAQEAIQLLVNGFKPQMMCCDIVLPGGMNGVELARKVHAIMPQVKVLLISGYGAGALNGSCNQDGFGILAKPYVIDELGQRVRKILDS